RFPEVVLSPAIETRVRTKGARVVFPGLDGNERDRSRHGHERVREPRAAVPQLTKAVVAPARDVAVGGKATQVLASARDLDERGRGEQGTGRGGSLPEVARRRPGAPTIHAGTRDAARGGP